MGLRLYKLQVIYKANHTDNSFQSQSVGFYARS
jgi:hypothetical protein